MDFLDFEGFFGFSWIFGFSRIFWIFKDFCDFQGFLRFCRIRRIFAFLWFLGARSNSSGSVAGAEQKFLVRTPRHDFTLKKTRVSFQRRS